jgi:hypothetical protein
LAFVFVVPHKMQARCVEHAHGLIAYECTTRILDTSLACYLEPSCTFHCAACSVDGLGKLMQAILDVKKSAAVDAASTKPGSKPLAVDAALQQAEQSAPAAATSSASAGSSSGSMPLAVKTLEAAAASGANTLDLSVRLLAGMRWAGLDQLDAASGKAKKLAVYR